MTRKEFSSTQIAEILGLNVRTVIDWAERGIVEADIVDATGPGSRRRYSFEQLIRAGVVQELRKAGMTRTTVKLLLGSISRGEFPKDVIISNLPVVEIKINVGMVIDRIKAKLT